MGNIVNLLISLAIGAVGACLVIFVVRLIKK